VGHGHVERIACLRTIRSPVCAYAVANSGASILSNRSRIAHAARILVSGSTDSLSEISVSVSIAFSCAWLTWSLLSTSGMDEFLFCSLGTLSHRQAVSLAVDEVFTDLLVQ